MEKSEFVTESIGILVTIILLLYSVFFTDHLNQKSLKETTCKRHLQSSPNMGKLVEELSNFQLFFGAFRISNLSGKAFLITFIFS